MKKFNKSNIVFLIAMLMITVCSILMSTSCSAKVRVLMFPDDHKMMTQKIQNAIDSCAKAGGGVAVFSAGTYLSGTIQLKSHVSLQFDKGVILQGSEKYADYENDAFIFGTDLIDIGISGEGIIDGVDCNNPNGEEGFRGPHCIRLINCKNISFKEFMIKNSANWAFNLRNCSFGNVEKVSIRGGHDGLHTRFCNNFKVYDCDFRTGDDAFAGNDNRDFFITECKINTSCNGFRIGCQNLTVRRCKLWGPGESMHKIQKRNNMLAAFVHFSPKDDHPELTSGNWLIEDVTIDHVDHVYVYNYLEGLWQIGQPVTNLVFKNVRAKGVLGTFNIIGDQNLKFNMKIEDSSFEFREGAGYKGDSFEGVKFLSPAFFNAMNFDRIELKNVTFSKNSEYPVFNCKSGNSLVFEKVNFATGNSHIPYFVEKVKKVDNDRVSVNGLPYR